MVANIVTAVDELLMNAIYDAQPDGHGDQAMRKVARTTPVALDARKAVELRIQREAGQIVITVVDQYGSLSRASVLSHILRLCKGGEYQLDPATAGAGLGLANIFQMGGSLHYVCEPGRRTEATVIFRKTDTYREFRRQFRFVAVQAD
jgi:hypothetical protein